MKKNTFESSVASLSWPARSERGGGGCACNESTCRCVRKVHACTKSFGER